MRSVYCLFVCFCVFLCACMRVCIYSGMVGWAWANVTPIRKLPLHKLRWVLFFQPNPFLSQFEGGVCCVEQILLYVHCAHCTGVINVTNVYTVYACKPCMTLWAQFNLWGEHAAYYLLTQGNSLCMLQCLTKEHDTPKQSLSFSLGWPVLYQGLYYCMLFVRVPTTLGDKGEHAISTLSRQPYVES